MLTISLCIICKDEAETLPRILKVADNYVDQIVIVDTGSIDNTKEIAKQFKAEVYDFEWCDDYSEARNFSFSKATSDYIFWLDGHDIIKPEFMEEAKNLLKSEPDSLLANYYTSFDNQGRPINTTYRIRFAKRSLDPHWAGIVHEALVCSTNNSFTMENVVYHCPVPKPEGSIKPNYLKLLIKNSDKYPEDARAWYYLGREYYYHKRYPESIESFRKCISMSSNWLDQKFWAHIYTTKAYMDSKEYILAEEECYKAIKLDPRWPDGYFVMGQICYFQEKWQEAINWFLKARITPEPASGFTKDKTIYSYRASLEYLPLCYHNIGNWELGLAESKLAIEICPDHPMAKQNFQWFSSRASEEIKEFIESSLHQEKRDSLAIYLPGSLGDILTTLNFSSQLRKKYKNIDYFCAPQIKSILGNFMISTGLVDNCFECDDYIQDKYIETWVCCGYPLEEGYPLKPMKNHLLYYHAQKAGVNFSFDCFKLNRLNINIDLPERFITIHNKTLWSPYKEWWGWQQLVDKLKSDFPVIDIIQIGGPDDPPLKNVDLSLLGKSFEENLYTQSKSLLHVGQDSVFNHSTNILWDGIEKIKGVILFGSTQASASGYPHNCNISLGLKCQPCFREYPGMTVSPIEPSICPHPKEQTIENPRHACMANISVDMVFDKIIENLIS